MRRMVGTVALMSALSVPLVASGQELLQEQPPTVTAESEPWYVSRAPLMVGGTLYFPAGAQVHFNRNEMIRSGSFGAIPVYVRTTLEPRSVIFIPLSGGLMQPYERRRSGELAGTEGSIPAAFPIQNPAERSGVELQALRAPGPPVGMTSSIYGDAGFSAASTVPQPSTSGAVATTGYTPMVPTHPLQSAIRPEGVNRVFVNFENQRWFSNGGAVAFDAGTFRQIGTDNGFAVYAHPAHPGTIFIPVAREASALVAPYSSVNGR